MLYWKHKILHALKQSMSRSKRMISDNPLTKFKDKFQLKYFNGSSWDKISEQCGLSRSNLINICCLDKEDIGKITIKTYLNIKHYLGVDLLNDW